MEEALFYFISYIYLTISISICNMYNPSFKKSSCKAKHRVGTTFAKHNYSLVIITFFICLRGSAFRVETYGGMVEERSGGPLHRGLF